MASSADSSYVVLLRPQTADAEGHPWRGAGVRGATVRWTGRLGRSGYPRYRGEGVEADIDPRTLAVEAVTVDGEELPYGWVAQVERDAPGRAAGPGGDA